jgi:hypothetical protein
VHGRLRHAGTAHDLSERQNAVTVAEGTEHVPRAGPADRSEQGTMARTVAAAAGWPAACYELPDRGRGHGEHQVSGGRAQQPRPDRDDPGVDADGRELGRVHPHEGIQLAYRVALIAVASPGNSCYP